MFSKKLIEVLEERFQVSRDFAAHLLPLFERLAERRPSPAEWEDVLGRVAAAYHSGNPQDAESDTAGEASELIGQFLNELQKMDESMKVLCAYIQRLRQHLAKTDLERIVH